MLNYAEETLHTSITRQTFRFADTLPLYLKGLFDYEEWTAFKIPFIVAKPHENLSVKTLGKHRSKLQFITGLPVVFAYGGATKYRMDRMVEAGIPFIVEGRQLFLPFLGVALKQEPKADSVQRIISVDKVSAQTQRFILKVMYDGWTNINVTDASERLGVAKITLSRVFDELEALDSNWITAEKKLRRFHLKTDRESFWRKVLPHLFNPVAREYRLGDIPICEHLALSGMSAISHHSMLMDDPWPTFAITKAQERELGLKGGKGLAEWSQWDQPACTVQVMRYKLDSIREAAIDPLSAILSLSEEDKEDPRIEGEIEDIMGRVLNNEFEGYRGL